MNTTVQSCKGQNRLRGNTHENSEARVASFLQTIPNTSVQSHDSPPFALTHIGILRQGWPLLLRTHPLTRTCKVTNHGAGVPTMVGSLSTPWCLGSSQGRPQLVNTMMLGFQPKCFSLVLSRPLNASFLPKSIATAHRNLRII